MVGKANNDSDVDISQAGGIDHFNIEPDLRPLARPIEGLLLDEHQARRHGPRSTDAIARSLERHGQKKAIVVERATGQVKAGNGTLLAARRLGWSHLAQVWSDEEPAMLRAYAIEDNRSAELSDWDPEKILAEIEEAPLDADDLGWDGDELAALEEAVGSFDIDADEPPDLPAGDREPYQQMTFTLHNDQAETVREAIAKALRGDVDMGLNENRNGNALALICEVFIGQG